MKTFITTLLLAITFTSIAQECSLIVPDNVKVMGMSRTDVNLAEVDTVVLPVVFHIVHTGAGEENNISDAQVYSQLDVLNEEFADSKIQFCMAARDPWDNPTDGITRFDGSIWEDYLYEGISNGSDPDAMDQEDLKEAVGCWNPSEYLNIYVVNEINGNDGGWGIQGFAYLGPTGDCRDGVVVLYNTVGTVGVQKPGRELGFTTVHEIGHHLSLWHTFSNSSGCGEESNCENQGDQVCDTPPTYENSSCSLPSCPEAMVENFMDYTPETCKNSFTVGQSERMHECLQTVRTGLVDNMNCIPPMQYDAAPTLATYQQQWCTPNQDIWIQVKNFGSDMIDIVNVELFCNGIQYNAEVFDLMPNVAQEVLFEDVYVDGAQMFEVQVVGAQNDYLENDYASWPIETTSGSLMSVVVSTDTWANETDWVIYDSSGEILIGDGNYSIGQATYTYEACIYDECYDVVIEDSNGDGFCSFDFNGDGVCDFGSDGITATVGNDTVFTTGYGASFDVWETSFCNTLPECPLDLDGSGTIGNGDVLIMLSNYGCQGICDYDINNDGNVNVYDLLEMLSNQGDCPVEQDFSIGTYKDLTIGNSDGFSWPSGPPRIYDILGREIDKPFDQLATGVYILRWKRVTRKVFVQ
jgi:hypothetical protein